MAILKCKMCGGDLNIADGVTVCECEYCGSKQTVPSMDNEKKITLFTRANRLRSTCEFDKAAGVYESIVAEFPEEAESYWGLVLCKYGIEYVDDPRTGKKIPTCHRSSFDCVLEDSNFQMVMEYSDTLSRAVYREEAKEIERLRVDIIAVSSKEEPYDIFICYKETDEKGDRTIDSVIAQDVYKELTENGYRVFFSRITLEDKLGQEYEPYIFAALNSAKVMLAFGTDYEYFNAVWVKNEWSRFLNLIEKGEKKTLIPCYKDIDAYDMPTEFKRLQAQDMGKVGAIQDLLRGIEKIIGKKDVQATNVNVETVQASSMPLSPVAPLLERVFMFLEDRSWDSADEYCEKVLDIDPKNAKAYLGKLLAEFRVCKISDLQKKRESFLENGNYVKLMKFADEDLQKEMYFHVAMQKKCFARTLNQYDEVLEFLSKAKGYKGVENSFIENLEKEIVHIKENMCNVRGIREKNNAASKMIKAEMTYGAYLKSDGTVVSCGDNRDGQRKVKQWRDILAIEATSLYVAGLCADGTVQITNDLKDVDYWEDIISISADWDHLVALRNDGTVVASGRNDSSQCDVGKWTDIIAIDASGAHTVGLKADGTVVACGDNQFGQCNVAQWRNIIEIYSQVDHTIGLKEDGTLVACGDNQYGQCNVRDWHDIVAVTNMLCYTLAINESGNVFACGDNSDGQCNVTEWTDIVAIATSGCHTVGLKDDCTVVACGDNSCGQCDVEGWKNVVAIACNADIDGDTWKAYTIGLTEDGRILACGDNKYGQCDVSEIKLFKDYNQLENDRINLLEDIKIREAQDLEELEQYKREEQERKEELLEKKEILLSKLSALGFFQGKERSEIKAELKEIEEELYFLEE